MYCSEVPPSLVQRARQAYRWVPDRICVQASGRGMGFATSWCLSGSNRRPSVAAVGFDSPQCLCLDCTPLATSAFDRRAASAFGTCGRYVTPDEAAMDAPTTWLRFPVEHALASTRASTPPKSRPSRHPGRAPPGHGGGHGRRPSAPQAGHSGQRRARVARPTPRRAADSHASRFPVRQIAARTAPRTRATGPISEMRWTPPSSDGGG